MIHAVIFDLDDTLYDYTTLNDAAIAQISRLIRVKYGLIDAEFKKEFNAARQVTKANLGDTAASHNRMLYFQKLLERLNRPIIPDTMILYETYWGYMLDHIRLRDNAKELLAYCKERKLKIGICSDLTTHIQHRKLERLNIAPYIDALVTSEEVGAEKPDPRMFSMILSKLGVEACQALYIGDSYNKDIIGAESAGMSALWLGGKPGDPHTILSLAEVWEKLR